jgi:GT2 family glycosyltransferase
MRALAAPGDPASQSQPAVTVIIPVRDDAERLGRCLEALARQTVPPLEVLVVDNGSSQAPVEVTEVYPRVRLLRETRPGSYAARNAAVSEAKGEVLAFTDADCLPAADWIQTASELVAHLGDDCFVGGRIDVFPRESGRPTAAELFEQAHAFPQRVYTERDGWSATANLVVSRATLTRVGRFDETLVSGGDREWGTRARRMGVRAVYAEEVRVAHPARHSYPELVRKLRRTWLGHAQLASMNGRRVRVRGLVARALRPPLKRTWTTWPTLPPTTRARLGYVVVALALHYRWVLELSRLEAGRTLRKYMEAKP